MRKLATIVGLLACLVYATLLPWHGAMRAAASSAIASLDAAVQGVICHGTGTAVVDAAAPKAPDRDAPAIPGQDCPICKSLAAMHLALLPAAALGVIERHDLALVWRPATSRAAAIPPPLPRSRGPPSAV